MGRRPFSLTAYLALARGRDRLVTASLGWPTRASRPLIWVHSDTRSRLDIVLSLLKRLQLLREDFSLLLTCDAAKPGAITPDGTPIGPPPAETLSDVQRFLTHWRPDILLWAGNGLRPALLHETAGTGCKMLLADAADAPWRQPSKRWLPDASAGALGLFDYVVAQSRGAAQRLRKLGVSGQRIGVGAPLEVEIFPLTSQDGLHEELSAVLAGRPVWLAANAVLDEADAILRAHRRASRLAHRLLLVFVPKDPGDEAQVAQMVQEVGLRFARWDNGEMPDENTQVLLAGDGSELGLWYRLAPLSFMGGTMASGTGGQSPMMAAALGSAVLYGPNVGQHLDAYSRLVAAGAARIVKDMDSLATAVTYLIAPDRAASMAHAGWEVVSAGAETTDMILSRLQDWLDAQEGRT